METTNNKSNRFKALPSFVSESLYSDYTLGTITDIRKKYLAGDLAKNGILKDIIALTVLKDIKIEQLHMVIGEGLKLDQVVSKEVTLKILCNIFYPIKDFFPGIEDEISKLGGDVPKMSFNNVGERLLKRDEEIEAIKEAEEKVEEEKMKDAIIEMPIRDLISNYPIVQFQQIGSQESIIVQGSDIPMKPEIKYWMKDYMEKAGYRMHSNLDRAQYVYHDKNTKNMNEEERRQLNFVLKSLDEGISLPYSTKTGKIDFSKIEES